MFRGAVETLFPRFLDGVHYCFLVPWQGGQREWHDLELGRRTCMRRGPS